MPLKWTGFDPGQNRPLACIAAYPARFQIFTVLDPAIDAPALPCFSSSAVMESIGRICSWPTQFGNVLDSTF